MFCQSGLKVYPLLFAFCPPASSGTARIIPASLSLVSGLSGSHINQQAVLFTSVTLSAQLCSSVTPHRGP